MSSTLKLLTVVGARPQFVKAAMVSRAIRESVSNISEEILHTGQHYDPELSDVFFSQMKIPQPAVNLGIGSGAHGEVTGKMLALIEREIINRRPDRVLVYGDTNSTLAGALAAAKLHVSVAHVEAGLRSHNRAMPEETNRVLTDHLSDILMAPTSEAVNNLNSEGIHQGVRKVGDVMFDAAIQFGTVARERSTIAEDLGLEPKQFGLVTVHRAENTDDSARLEGILKGLSLVNEQIPLVFPIHPRTRSAIERNELNHYLDGMTVIDPVSFFDMVLLEKDARLIFTDSGGVQKEAYFHGVPCVTLRDETEWVETVEKGWNQLVGACEEKISNAVVTASTGDPIEDFGEGETAGLIVSILENAS